MSWSDALKGSLGALLNQAQTAALPNIMRNMLGTDGLQTILSKLHEGGMGEHVGSWIDNTRENMPISSEQLRAALGNEHLQQLAGSLGLPVDKLLAVLSEHLPQAAGAAGENANAGDSAGEPPR